MELSVSTESELIICVITYISLGLGLGCYIWLHPRLPGSHHTTLAGDDDLTEVAEQPRMRKGGGQKRTGDSYSTEHPVDTTHHCVASERLLFVGIFFRTRHGDRTLSTAI